MDSPHIGPVIVIRLFDDLFVLRLTLLALKQEVEQDVLDVEDMMTPMCRHRNRYKDTRAHSPGALDFEMEKKI